MLKSLLKIIAIILIIIAIVYLIAALFVFFKVTGVVTTALAFGATTSWAFYAWVAFGALTLAYIADPETTTYYTGKVTDAASAAATTLGSAIGSVGTGVVGGVLSGVLTSNIGIGLLVGIGIYLYLTSDNEKDGGSRGTSVNQRSYDSNWDSYRYTA